MIRDSLFLSSSFLHFFLFTLAFVLFLLSVAVNIYLTKFINNFTKIKIYEKNQIRFHDLKLIVKKKFGFKKDIEKKNVTF